MTRHLVASKFGDCPCGLFTICDERHICSSVRKRQNSPVVLTAASGFGNDEPPPLVRWRLPNDAAKNQIRPDLWWRMQQ